MFLLSRVCGTYTVNGTGYVSSSKYNFTTTWSQTTTFSGGTVEITAAGDGSLAAVITIGQRFDGTGEGPYTYDESHGAASFVDSNGLTDTLVFTAANGQIQLEITMFFDLGDATLTVSLTGIKN